MSRRILGFWFLIWAAFVPAALADAPAAAPAPDAAAAAGKASSAAAVPSGLVSLDFQDADIRNVLKVLAFKSGINIVAAPDVTGVVNIELKDVPWQKALDVILSTYGYGFDRKDNIITVMTVENLKKYREDALALQAQEPLVSKTYALSFAKARDVMKIIDKMVSKRGFMSFDERTNSVIVRDLQGNLDLIGPVIKSIDTVTPQVLIETKVIETDLDATDNIGIDWVVTGNISHSVTHPKIDLTTRNFSTASGINANVNGSATAAATPSDLSFTYGTINNNQLNATLNFLSSRTNTKVLSNPHIVTLDNEKAKINVGLQYPVPSYSFNSQTGQEQVTGYTPLSIGVNFEVTPHVNNAGLITLDLHPQISSLKGQVVFQNNPFPETTNQEAETNVMVEDGRTLVIGGLITDQVNVNKTKLPVLGDIPLVGSLFKSTSTVKVKEEVLIFLTPHIITVGNKDSAPSASAPAAANP